MSNFQIYISNYYAYNTISIPCFKMLSQLADNTFFQCLVCNDASYLLLIGTDIIFDEGDVVYGAVAEDRYSCKYCFYDVLADYFVCMPQSGDSIIDLIVQLWSQIFASNIFCLLFYKRVCIYFLLVHSFLYYSVVLGCIIFKKLICK